MTPAFAELRENLAPAPSERRGECPTLQKPMQTGDGLLARLRPVDNIVTPRQLRALAQAAQQFGNGIVEITARGSLQIRGLKPEAVAPFEHAVLATGIDISTGVAIEIPPLAGLDPQELIDIRPIAKEIRTRIGEHVPPLVLAPKLAITVDGGGRFHLGSVPADVKVTAFRDEDGVKFVLALGGVATRAIAVLERDQIVDGVIGMLERLSALGPAARGRNLDLPLIGGPQLDFDAPPLVGIHRLYPDVSVLGSTDPEPVIDNHTILGIAFSYRQASSASLIAFAETAETLGASDIRFAPGHGLFVTGLTLGNARELQETAAALGFLTAPDDPRNSIALCAGARGCASAFYDTQALAAKILAHAPALLDGSFDLHLSGCAKGCAHPGASILTFAGARSGYGLVVNGAASAVPATYIAENHIDTALQRLQALLRQSKEDGETARACLTRLGGGVIAAALQLDGT